MMKRLIVSGLLVLALAGCGGDANTGSNGTGSVPLLAVASGPVTSMAPLGVAGARMDDAGTQVLLNANAERPATDLRLGMFADAGGMVAPDTGAGTAATAVAQSVVLGPVASVDPVRRTLEVLGQPVRADQNTLLEGIEHLDQLAAGDWVEVFGLRLPGNEGTLATRLIAGRVPEDRSVEVLGTVSDFSAGPPVVATPGLRVDLANASIGAASPAGLQPLPPGIASLQPGAQVRVRGRYDPGSGTVTATSVTTGFEPARPEGRLVYVEGFVLAQTSTLYRVGDLYVDTTTLGVPLAVGSRVRLRGFMTAGALRVDQVTVVAPGELIEYVVEGPITTFVSIADFTVRGERIDASQAVLPGGAASMLGQGRRVRVRGVAGPGKLVATEVAIVN